MAEVAAQPNASYTPSKKQVAAHLAFLVEGFKRGVLFWGRQCFAPETLIRTNKGLKPISDIAIGDLVLSYGKEFEYKLVTNTWRYGVDFDPKPMIQCIINKQEVNCTYDHPFYYKKEYIPIYQLAWGNMAISEREELELLCQQYGQTLDYEALRRIQDGSNEASQRLKRLPQNGSRRQDSQVAPSGSSNLDTKSTEQSNGKSQERGKDRQSRRKPGVDDTSGEYNLQSPERLGSQQRGRELRDSHLKRETSVRDTSLSDDETKSTEANHGERTKPEVSPSKSGLYTGHFEGENLEISAVKVLPSAVTYSIEVADNHNYCITEKNILVKNSGKTWFAVNHGWLSATIAQGRYFIVFDTYKHAHEVVWRQYLSIIPKELIFKTNEADLIIEFNYIKGPVKLPDGTVVGVEHDMKRPRSILQLLGSDQADTHRGFKADGMIFDEYADQNPDNWAAVYEPFFATTNGWAIFMGTPRGYNHFYEFINFAKEDSKWLFQQATWRDSPYVSREHIAESKRTAEKKGTLSTWMQEYELEFRAVQGAVYPKFDREVHIVRPSDIPDELTIYAGIDFGYHVTACILVGIDKDQNWWVFDEIYGRQEILSDIVPRIRNKLADKRLVLMVGDSQAKDAIESMSKDFPITPVVKRQDSIIHGINLIRTKLKPRIQLVGKPKPTIFFSNVCKNLIQEIEAYRYPEDKPDRNPSELPLKEDDHGPDAIRYLVLHLKYGLNKEDKLPKNSILKDTNQFGLL